VLFVLNSINSSVGKNIILAFIFTHIVAAFTSFFVDYFIMDLLKLNIM